MVHGIPTVNECEISAFAPQLIELLQSGNIFKIRIPSIGASNFVIQVLFLSFLNIACCQMCFIVDMNAIWVANEKKSH